MDVHRCRFVPYPPSTINIIAFSHSQFTKATPPAALETLRLAIGRANGDIEIWNPFNGAWLQESILRGGQDRSVDGLVWIQDPDEEDFAGNTICGKLRLFSIGYTTTITEWDLEKGRPLRESSGNHGEIWCLAAQPSLPQASKLSYGTSPTGWLGQNLVTGCTDGAVVLHSTADQDLKLQRVLVRPSAKKAKVISILFKGRNVIVAGCTDSTIRIYDIRTNALIRSISMGATQIGGQKEIIVWAVKCLPNGNIVSGDSTGEVRIWDGKTYTLVQRIKSHRQDVLSLATSVDGSTILSGGMDRRTVVYKQIGKGKPRWAEVTHKRYHRHDVKTMAAFEGNGMSVVVSGGPDSSPMVVPLRAFDQENQRMLPSLPQRPALLSVPKKRLIMSWWDREVHIWRISEASTIPEETVETENEAEQRPRNRTLVARIAIKGEANINSASINMNGDLVAVSTPKNVKIFRLRPRISKGGDFLKVSKLEVPHKISTEGARHIQFSPDGHWLCVVRMDSRVVVARILSGEDDPSNTTRLVPSIFKLERINRKIEKRILLGGLGAYDRIINRVAFSADSCILAVGDLAGYIDTWVLEGQEDLSQPIQDPATANNALSSDDSDGSDNEEPAITFGQRWRRNPSASLIPRLPAPAVVLSFRPASLKAQAANGLTLHPTRQTPHPISHDLPHGEARLLVVTAKTQVFEFEVLRGSLSTWSRSNPPAKFPPEFKAVMDQAMDCFWDIKESRERLWLYGSRWMWMFDLSRDFPVSPLGEKEHAFGKEDITGKASTVVPPNLKRKRNETSGAGGQIPDKLLQTGMSRKIQLLVHEDKTEVNEVMLDYGRDIGLTEWGEESEVSPETAKTSPLSRSRKVANSAIGTGQDNESEEDGEDNDEGAKEHHWWHTYKYRPIIGIVPLGREGPTSNSHTGLEVALVERPEWEVDLPPRYYGDHEWDQPGL